MRLGQNVLAGLANSVWTVLANLIAIPFYIHYLGIEAYGLIGFMVTLHTVLLALDLGLGPTVNREIARFWAQQQLAHAAPLLHTLASFYWLVAIALGIGIGINANWISTGWLDARQLPEKTVSDAIVLMGIIIGCRWPTSLYQSALMGAQKLATCSIVSSIIVALNTLGGVAVLAFISADITALFIWQAGTSLVHALTLRRLAWQALGPHPRPSIQANELKRIWRFSAGMLGVTLTALLAGQVDKLLLSKLIELETFGQYMLASTMAGSLYILATSLFNAMYPRFSALIAQQEHAQAAGLYHTSNRLLASLLLPAAMVLGIFGEPIIHVWTGNPELAKHTAPIAALLSAGVALHGMTYMSYALQLAHGITRVTLALNTALLCVLIPAVIAFTQRWGVIGAAIAWCMAYTLYLCIVIPITQRLLAPRSNLQQLFNSAGIPLLLTVFAGLLGHYINDHYAPGVVPQLALATICGLTVALTSIALAPVLRTAVIHNLKGLRNSFFA